MVAITAVEGCVDAERVTSNVENIVESIDPEKWPRLGAAKPAENAIAVDTRFLHGDDGLGNLSLTGSAHLNRINSAKLMGEQIRQAPGEVSIVCLGPLTNVNELLTRDPTTATLIDRLFIVGGSVEGIGNITPCAEFNMFFDPHSAREVFRSAITKTLIPLDLTRQVDFGLEFLDGIKSISPAAFLRSGLHYFFQSFRQHLARESILLNDAVGLVAALHDDLIKTEDLAGDIETAGELTRGMTIFDRRDTREWRTNMEVGTEIDVEKTQQRLTDLLAG